MRRDQQVQDEEQLDSDDMKYILFRVESHLYGMPIEHIKEIVKFSHIASVPNTESAHLGVFNLRGKIISIVDIKELRSHQVQGDNHTKLVLVLDTRPNEIGIVVDQVLNVLHVKKVDAFKNVRENLKIPAEFQLGVVELSSQLVNLIDFRAFVEGQKYAS